MGLMIEMSFSGEENVLQIRYKVVTEEKMTNTNLCIHMHTCSSFINGCLEFRLYFTIYCLAMNTTHLWQFTA
jgi:hypothetical protein